MNTKCLTALNRILTSDSAWERFMRAFFLTSGGYGDGFTLRDLAVKQEGGLAQGGLQVEGVEGRGGVFGYDQLEPPQSSAGGGVMDADVHYSTARR